MCTAYPRKSAVFVHSSIALCRCTLLSFSLFQFPLGNAHLPWATRVGLYGRSYVPQVQVASNHNAWVPVPALSRHNFAFCRRVVCWHIARKHQKISAVSLKFALHYQYLKAIIVLRGGQTLWNCIIILCIRLTPGSDTNIAVTVSGSDDWCCQ